MSLDHPPAAPLDASRADGADGRAGADGQPVFADLLADLDEVPEPRRRRHRVTAVLVAHDGARWLRHSLPALSQLARGPDALALVDTGSTDTTPDLLQAFADAAGDPAGADAAAIAVTPVVVTLPADSGFGAAVAAGLAAAAEATGRAPGRDRDGGPGDAVAGDADPLGGPTEPVDWVWLLHDDLMVHPDALSALLRAADEQPSAAVLGPKARGWSHPTRLVEVGLTVSGGGRLETGLERHEVDQGQHDGTRDVLAVGSAGMLVRRDVWDALDGLDPQLPLFRDALDLGWRTRRAGYRVLVVPDALVRHAAAAAHGRRPLASGERPHRADRSAALYVQLANGSTPALLWQYPRLALGSLGRSAGLLLAKAPGDAADELAALSVLLRPDRIARARRARRATSAVPASEVRPYLAAPLSGARHGLDSLRAALSGLTPADAALEPMVGAGGVAPETGPVEEDAEALLPTRTGLVRGLLRRPGVLLVLALLAVSAVAFRGLLLSGSAGALLQGGSLLPAPDGARALWQSYTQSWHDVGVGSGLSSPPWLAVVAALATLLLGKASWAVTALLVLAVPLAGWACYVALGRLVPDARVRAVGAAGYALLPATTAALSQGRLGTAVAAWVLPLLLLAGARAVGLGGPPSGRAAAAAAVLLAVAAAFSPPLLVLAPAAGLLALLLAGRSPDRTTGSTGPATGRAVLHLVLATALAAALLLPWLVAAVDDPARLWLEAGIPVAAAPVAPATVPLAAVGGAGQPWPWLLLPLLLAGVAALARADRRRAVAAAWVVVLVGLAGSVVLGAARPVPAALGEPVAAWRGPAALLLGAGLVIAAVLAGERLRARLAQHGFGWRQPLGLALAGLAAVVPLALAGAWTWRGVADPLTTGPRTGLPAYVQAAGATPQRPRTLLLTSDQRTAGVGPQAGPVGYAVVTADGSQLGDADVAPAAAAQQPLTDQVARLLTGRASTQDVAALGRAGIGFVVVAPGAGAARLTRALDDTPGLVRVSASADGTVWRLGPRADGTSTTARAWLDRLGPDGRSVVATVPLPVGPDAAAPLDQDLPAPPAGEGRLRLTLADSADARWQARLGDLPLQPVTVDGWAQGFALPPGTAAAGSLVVRFDDPSRHWWLGLQAALLVAALVAAAPGRRRETDESDAEPDVGADAEPEKPPGAAPGPAGRAEGEPA